MKTKTQKTINKVETTKVRLNNEIVTNGINLLSTAKKNTKNKIEKKQKISFHKSLLNVNKLDKQENFSLSGALKRFEKQIPNDEQYKGIDTNVISKGLEFSTILKFVNKKCIENKRFTVYAVGLAFNKFLKETL